MAPPSPDERGHGKPADVNDDLNAPGFPATVSSGQALTVNFRTYAFVPAATGSAGDPRNTGWV